MTAVHTFTTGEGDPDFTVRSGPNPDVVFHVQRAALVAGSEVFRDMFSVCSWSYFFGTVASNRTEPI
jgi:hypothetical protein